MRPKQSICITMLLKLRQARSLRAINFKEFVLAPHESSRLLEYPDAHAILQLTANANPASPTIWSKVLDQ